MPWKGVIVSEQRQRFLEDYQLYYYTITELGEQVKDRSPTPQLEAVRRIC